MHPRVITYSRNAFLPLTTVCRNTCGYCCFRTPVQEGCIMPPAVVEETIRYSASMGCTEALFTFGEQPGMVEGFDAALAPTGYATILDYCYDMCRAAIDAGMLPHTNAGILTREELERFRTVNASMGLMLETTAEIPAHRKAPGKAPEVRIAMMEDAGRLKIPFTTGLLIGIGETPRDREESLEVIRDLHRRYGHIQEVIIQNFCPKEGTPMEAATYPGTEEMCGIIRLAREILPDDVMVQVPPNLADAAYLIECGVDDLGGVSPVTIDYVNPEHPWPQIEELQGLVGTNMLRERLCIYQRFIDRGWNDPSLEGLIKTLAEVIEERNMQMMKRNGEEL
ncbi:7,8-didemethyl-8-hydroxy-5-deazariboflavin synthase subunit CofG [Methanomicrobiaceae archaeon CYW5]|uniref:7,8-didemethyl-8-hydroxy-5-deazariboflavin synthase subunit CofG n=1 Tax=Methanovulcanius yangii TaxID=1789227 RepID=UPI0029CA592D|nr:7,8-didemethyl-8-hydroxy-5-deazariboflavin synthase subunit CofG [Methanovulcanius yangii]MBT8507517.1 7,8-didemethyl-8-hydroxy-5-deazariboflavin synthase subunit CofG [Methanovulcanius yangii]